jgi:Transcription initiation factor IID, 18kD subunit
MYAFGDVANPEEDSVNLMEEYLFGFLNLLVSKGVNRRARRDVQANKLTKEDLLWVIKSDPKWMARISYIMERKREITKI